MDADIERRNGNQQRQPAESMGLLERSGDPRRNKHQQVGVGDHVGDAGIVRDLQRRPSADTLFHERTLDDVMSDEGR